MAETLFSISCTTCGAKLAVRSADSIGAIVACPKCGSMVQIVPPDGWEPPESGESVQEPADADSVSPAGDTQAPPRGNKPPNGPPVSQPPAAQPPAVRPPVARGSQASAGGSPSGIGKARPADRRADGIKPAASGREPAAPPAASSEARSVPPKANAGRKGRRPPKAAPPAAASGATAVAGMAGAAPAAPPVVASAGPPPVALPSEPVPPPAPGEPVAPVAGFASPVELLWRRWLPRIGAPLAGLVVISGLWGMLSRGRPVEPPPAVVEADPKVAPVAVVEEPAPAGPDHFDARWLPDNTVLLADLHACEGLASAQGGLLLDAAADWWRPAVAAPLAGLGLNLQAVRRLRLVSTDLAAWPDRLLLVLELNAGHDATLLAVRGEGVPIAIGEATCRRLTDGPWTHPFAVLDAQTVLTGDEAILSALVGQGTPRFRSEPIRRMLDGKSLQLPADVRFLIDLSAARAAGWRLPSAAFDVWPEARQAWRALWETPVGLGVAMRWPNRLQCKVAFPCESETTAEEVRGALDTLVPLAKQALASRLATLTAADGKTADPAAQSYAPFLAEATTALQSVQWNLDEKTVLVDVAWGTGPWELAGAALAAWSPLHADWLGAALTADSLRQQRILAGLADFQQAEGAWPSGAVGGSLLPPETRLSWIAELLPYYGHADWHRSLRFGYAWNSPQNRSITRRQLDHMVNPALGASRTEAGYPVTHYVGVGGVGPDAPTLPVDHPRAGVFGFGRRTRLEDIGDGAANAIAILGVTQDLGPWAAGGHATVRPLTKRPYVNGPDGFGSGQADGMLAGMADGSVRFISKDVDPEVIELLATINSRSNVTVAALGDAAKPRLDTGKPRSDAGKPRSDTGKPGPDAAEPVAAAEPQPPAAAEEPIPAEPARPPLPAVDVVARLAEPFAQIAVAEMPLGQAVALVAQLGGVPVTFDPEGLESLGVSLRDPVSVDRGNAPLAVVLKDLLHQRGLAYFAEGGQVVVTVPAAARDELVARRYSVDDLAEDEAALEELDKTVRKLIATESWQGQGGSGSIFAKDRALHVEQTRLVHHKLLVFFEKLRTARGLPLRSQSPSDWFQLASRRSRASTVLEKKTSLNYREPAPLVEVLGRLGVLAGADILIDRRALAIEGIPDSEPASVTVTDEPLLAALDKLLRPLGLAWRALDASTLQVSTQAALDETMELEFYPVAPLLDGLVTGATLMEQICNRIAGPTWFDAGGPGVIHYDAKGQCLIVRHNQAVQAAVERLLREQPAAPSR